MGNKIVTEADRKYTPPLKALPGVTLPKPSHEGFLFSKKLNLKAQ